MSHIRQIVITVLCLGLAGPVPARAEAAGGKDSAAVKQIIKALETAADEKEEQKIRGQLFAVVRKMAVPPAMSEEARKDMFRAELKVKEGDFDAAAKEYRKAAALAPFAAKIYYNLALVYGKLEDYKAARKWMSVYLEAAPEAPDARAAKDEILKWEIQLEEPEAAGGAAPEGNMVLISAGAFLMGSPEGAGSNDEYPRHKVYLDAYYIDKYPVTVGEYRKFAKATGREMPDFPRELPNFFSKIPVIEDYPFIAKWAPAEAYCKWAGKRLPTEAEWEKAARGGADTRWDFGDDKALLGDYAWYAANSGYKLSPIGLKKPNKYGLYDMLGNLWQWTADWYDSGYYQLSPAKNPKGPASGKFRAARGRAEMV